MNIEDAISADLGIPRSMIKEAILVARRDVKKFEIEKRSGGTRSIFHPSKKLKTIQYWLIHNIFEHMPVHISAAAYRPGLSTLNNAEKHAANRFFLKMDLKEFFPSINFSDFTGALEEWHALANPDWPLDSRAKEIIRLSCFYKGDALPIGFPGSPIISNIVMYSFDEKITSLIGKHDKYGDCVYTRYADDLIFSTNKEGVCYKLLKEVSEIISEMKSPKLRVNTLKTRVGSSTGGSALVTGLKVCNDGHITIHRKQKDHVRLMLSLYSKGALKEDDQKSLLGHLSYCRHVDPRFYSNLLRKYFKEVDSLKKKPQQSMGSPDNQSKTDSP